MPKRSADLCLKVRSNGRLWKAWRHVHQNGITSKSADTRTEVRRFQDEAERHIPRIARQLRENRFQFLPAHGIPQKRKGKAARPIVHAPVENRLVQRSILDVLQELPAMEPLYAGDASFGGIKGRGVREALQAAYGAASNGAEHYIRSDIASFFTQIPKSDVLERIDGVVAEPDFMELLEKAVHLELSNLETLRDDAELFPLHEVGVAQGCCLSPLIGNVLLGGFDKQMNGRGIVCLRYIDDFLILGPTKSKVRRAFESAQRLLDHHGLRAYDPNETGGKADAGMVSKGFEFLGCDVRPGMITPNQESRHRLKMSVSATLESSAAEMRNPKKLAAKRRSVVETLSEVNNVVRGWGNQYAYCNNEQVLQQLDTQISAKIEKYLSKYAAARRGLGQGRRHEDRRRLLGIHLLVDSRKEPIVQGAVQLS